MASRDQITDELREISPGLAQLNAVTPYRVPAGYFDDLASLILLRIKTEEAGSADEELKMISPFLGELKKTMPYSVPQDYFERLEPKISRVEQKPRVVSISVNKVFRYAATAVTVGLITVAAWFLLKTPATKNDQYAFKQDSVAEKQVQENIDSISDNEISNFLDGINFGSIGQDGVSPDINEEDITLMLADVSDQELENYLQQQNSMKEKFN